MKDFKWQLFKWEMQHFIWGFLFAVGFFSGAGEAAGELVAPCSHNQGLDPGSLMQTKFRELIFKINRAGPFLKYLPSAESSVLEDEVLSQLRCSNKINTHSLAALSPSCRLFIHQCQFCFSPKIRLICHSGSDSSDYFHTVLLQRKCLKNFFLY